MVKKTIDATRILDRLKTTLEALPPGIAKLEITEDDNPHPHQPGWRFRIVPNNPRSARIRGLIDSTFGIYVVVGEGTSREIFLASRSKSSNIGEEEEFFAICRAAFETNFSEEVTYASNGKVLRSEVLLRLDGRNVRLGGHRIFWWLFPGRTAKHFSYEPY